MTKETALATGNNKLLKYKYLEPEEKWERQRNIEIIKNGNLTHALTFNSNQVWSKRLLTKKIHEWERQFKQYAGEIIIMKFIEHAGGNSHIHSVARLSGRQRIALTKKGKLIWETLTGGQGRLYIDT